MQAPAEQNVPDGQSEEEEHAAVGLQMPSAPHIPVTQSVLKTHDAPTEAAAVVDGPEHAGPRRASSRPTAPAAQPDAPLIRPFLSSSHPASRSPIGIESIQRERVSLGVSDERGPYADEPRGASPGA